MVSQVSGIMLLLCISNAHGIEGEEKVNGTAQALVPYFAAQPAKELSSHFSERFLKAVSAKQLEGIFQSFHADYGKATGVRLTRMTAPYAGDVEFIFEKGFRVPTQLVLEGTPPHKVTGLVFRGPIKDDDKLDDILTELKALPGTVSFCLKRLGDSPQTIAELNSAKPLGVGSAFKLLVFATLVADIEQGKRAWTDVVTVRKDWVSLPAGLVQDWPEGSPVTLHTLATLMISKSDNTACDHLIRLLGRQRIEAMQKAVGVQAPERNQPFLCSGEFFKIKLVLDKKQQEEYLAADSAHRRQLLATSIKNASLAKPRMLASPLLSEEIEWFFTTADMCRVMDWLRGRHDPKTHDILAINTGLPLDKTTWPYIGFKGGSEPGVLNYTLLLRNKTGDWFAFAITWNNPKHEVEQTKLLGLAQRLIRLAQR